MGSQGIIGQAMTFRNQLEIGLTGLEEHLDLPALSVDADDLFFGKVRLRADKGNPVLLILMLWSQKMRDTLEEYVWQGTVMMC